MFDADKAAAATTRMWLKVARLLATGAISYAEEGEAALAVKLASLADCCFWQATGENDSMTFEKAFRQGVDA